MSQLLNEFDDAAARAQIPGWPTTIRHEIRKAPHQQPSLPTGAAAVYAFSLSRPYGTHAPAGPDRVLKVGKVGPKSDARFRSQHYGLSAGSTLAKSLISHKVLWPWLGISELDVGTVKNWMLSSLDRDHFFVAEGQDAVVTALEIYVRARTGM